MWYMVQKKENMNEDNVIVVFWYVANKIWEGWVSSLIQNTSQHSDQKYQQYIKLAWIW